MIIGLLIRNYKTYSGISYVPMTYGDNFCGLVGNNGIGKSSILEALDSLFNNKPWNYNIIVKKSGYSTTRPHIVPIFLTNLDCLSESNKEISKKLNDYIWDLEDVDVLSQNRNQFKIFKDQLNILKRNFKAEFDLLIPLGLTYDSKISLSIFNTRKLGELFITDFDKTQQQVQDDELSIFESLLNDLKDRFEYIYIPKDIDPENFAQLETKEIQSLMGETLIEIVEKKVPQGKIQEINQSLNEFISSLTSILEEYSFRTIGERQVNLRKHDVYKLIVEAYFKIRKLHKREGPHWLEMSVLSSGEKQKAIIEIAYNFLKSYRKNTKNLILALDEPESSLHMSACFDQFDKLFEVSKLCKQVIFTTHWYGFLPTIEGGSVSVISKRENEHAFDLIGINSYREEVKQTIRASKGKLPFDIRLKGINDFIQSIITSILANEPYNWLICEGSSEKTYFEHYFSKIKQHKKLRIIPVGGATEVRRIYNNLQVAYDDFKKDIQGKVILIYDTDSELIQYPTKDEFSNLRCFRIVNNVKERKTILVKPTSNSVSPKTEIEDSLNGKLFYETLLTFIEEYPGLENITRDINNPSEDATYFSLDLTQSKQAILEDFFNLGNNKFEFAKRYSSNISESYKVPDWINEIVALL